MESGGRMLLNDEDQGFVGRFFLAFRFSGFTEVALPVVFF